MTPTAMRILALLLVPLQVWMASFRGQTLCVPILHCEERCTSVAEGSCPNGPSECHGHSHHDSHGGVDGAEETHPECGCHVHLPASTDDDATARRSLAEATLAMPAWAPMDVDPPLPSWRWAHHALRPPDTRPTPHLAGWTTTRLLI